MSKRRLRLLNAKLDRQQGARCPGCGGSGRVERFVKPDVFSPWWSNGYWVTESCRPCQGRGRK